MGFIGVTELYVLVDLNSWTDLIASALLSLMLAGQIILLVAIFKPRPDKKLTIAGVILLGIIVLLIFCLMLFYLL